MSKYAYFYYAFLFGGVTFFMFFDPEKLTINGESAEDRIQDMKNFYSRDVVPKAKEITEDEKNNELANNNSTKKEAKQVSKNDSDSKKSKSSFRNRKVICI